MHTTGISQKMRIGYVGTKGIPARWGGIETYVEQIGKRLAGRGHDVTVFSSRWYSAGCSGSHHEGMCIARVPSLRLQATDALTNGLFASLAVINGLYDIVHFHGLASYFYVPLVRKFGKITVTTTHAMESNWDNRKYNRLGRWAIKRAFEVGIRHAHRTSTVARHLQAKMERRYAVKPVMLPAGLEPAQPSSAQIITDRYGLRGNDFLLFLGRIDPIKRIEWIVDLHQAIPADMRIVIAGGAQDSTTEAYLRSLQKAAKGCANVIFTGAVAGREKSELLSNCIMLLAPSADEGMPLTLLEASSYGKPSVVSDLPAFQAVIEHGATGFLFPKEDPQAFVSMVGELLHSPNRLKAVGLAAQRELTPRFDWDHTADRTEKLYYELLSQKRQITRK